MKKKLFINGNWVEGSNFFSLYSPYSEELIAEIPIASENQINEAINAAVQAKKTMVKMHAHERASVLERLVNLLKSNEEKAAKIIAMESAKPLKYAIGEVKRTIQTYQFAAEEAKRTHGETIPLDAAPGGEDKLAYTVRNPLGVVGAITPFNFPMNLVAHKLGPAIASGNTVILKPASQTPLSSYYIAELLQEAGLPSGVLNVITGSGKEIGDKIVQDPRVDIITFTGSPSVGKRIRNKAGLKRTLLELGSNAGLIVDNNVNLDKIIPRCVEGAFSNQGQVCISLQRIYVHEEIYQEFVNRFIEKTKTLTLGNPMDVNTDISAMISKGEVERTLSWIDEAKNSGASIGIGGERRGNILLPTVILNADASLKVSCQEVFAPVVIINKVKAVEEAIDFINDSAYGLQAGIYTNNVQHALFAADKLHVGGVLINEIPTFRVDHMPYGGVKESGVGREGIKYAMEEMTEMKLVIWNKSF